MALVIVLIVVLVAGLVFTAIQMRRAPMGWEDPETGFHYGEPPK
jgi:hypothetical protein